MTTAELIQFLQQAEADNGGPLPVWLCHSDEGYTRLSMVYIENEEYFQAVDGTDIELPLRVEIFVG